MGSTREILVHSALAQHHRYVWGTRTYRVSAHATMPRVGAGVVHACALVPVWPSAVHTRVLVGPDQVLRGPLFFLAQQQHVLHRS